MSKFPDVVIDKCSYAHRKFVEEVIKIADENDIDRNELIKMAISVGYLMRNCDYSEYTFETEETGAVVNG